MTHRLFDDLRFVPIAYATCMWCHNLVSNPHSVWSNGGLTLTGRVKISGISKVMSVRPSARSMPTGAGRPLQGRGAV